MFIGKTLQFFIFTAIFQMFPDYCEQVLRRILFCFEICLMAKHCRFFIFTAIIQTFLNHCGQEMRTILFCFDNSSMAKHCKLFSYFPGNSSDFSQLITVSNSIVLWKLFNGRILQVFYFHSNFSDFFRLLWAKRTENNSIVLKIVHWFFFCKFKAEKFVYNFFS